MSFPLASIAVYSSVVFGVFSNTQRFLSQLRHRDPSHKTALTDVALASIVSGFVSVGIGTPVELVKIRLQMQTQPCIEGRRQEFLFPSSASSRALVRALGHLCVKAQLSAALSTTTELQMFPGWTCSAQGKQFYQSHRSDLR